MKDYSEDMAICDAATDGPWFVADYTDDAGHYFVEDGRSAGLYDIRAEGNEAKYIAHFNPIKVREMLERIGGLEAFVTSISEASLMESDEVIKATFHGYIKYAEELLK